MKKAISIIISVVMLVSVFFALPVSAASEVPNLEAEASLVMDLSTGTVLHAQNADERVYPASTTKIMTCILALEMLDMNTVVTCDDEVAATGGSVLGLKDGEEITVKDLVNAMMVRSANDCALALAKEAGGNLESFIVKMNDKAAALGCTGTHFVNPHGLHDDDHYTTASDLAIIARYCMQNDTFRQIVAQAEYTVPATNKSEARTVQNSNLLLFDENDANRIYVNNELRYCKYEDCIGIKTGYTTEAQGCLVAAAQKHGTTILTVAMKSSNFGRYADSIKLLDWAFDNYRTLRVMDKGADLGIVKVKKGEFNKVSVNCGETLLATIPSEASDAIITTEVVLDESVTAPVAEGQKLGSVLMFESGNQIGSYDVVATEAIAEGGFLSNFGIEDATARRIGHILLAILIFLFLCLVAYVLIMRRQTRIKRERRAAKIRARQEEELRRRRQWENDYEERYKQSRYSDDE